MIVLIPKYDCTVDSRYLELASRITAYLVAIIWSLLKHENLTTGNKILWKRGAYFSSFHNIFNVSLTSGVKLHIHFLTVAV